MTALAYVGRCVELAGEDIRAMVDDPRERQITQRTFLRAVGGYAPAMAALEAELGYTPDFRMARDWMVTYHRGFYQGRRCVFFRWSAIEYIFAERRACLNLASEGRRCEPRDFHPGKDVRYDTH